MFISISDRPDDHTSDLTKRILKTDGYFGQGICLRNETLKKITPFTLNGKIHEKKKNRVTI